MINRIYKIDQSFEPNEGWLQKYLASHPEILPVQDLDGISSPLQLIARELIGIDLLFVNERGLLTIVETKLSQNPELRRVVVAQLLDYASQLRKLDVVGLCQLIARLKGNKAIQGLANLEQLTQVLSKHLSIDSPRKELTETVKAVFAHYVVQKGRIEEYTELSEGEKRFLEKLDLMLKEGSFRLVVVTYDVHSELLDLLNYTNSTMQRGCQLVAFELSIDDIEGNKYFVPHLVGAPGYLSSEYYREENGGNRIYREWTKEQFLNELPVDLSGDLSNLIDEIEDREDRLQYSFGTGGKGSLLLGAKVLHGEKVNNLLAIWTTGEVTLYFSLAQNRLSEIQKNALLSEISKRPFLQKAYASIQTGSEEPKFKLRDIGAGEERVKKLLALLEDFHRVANS